MAAAVGAQAEVAAAAHIQAHLRGGTALTARRIQGFGPSVQARGALLDRLLADHGRVEALDDAGSDSFWESMRTVAPLGGDDPLWRVNVPPSRGSAVVARSEEHTSELQSLMRISYAVFCLKKKKNKQSKHQN